MTDTASLWLPTVDQILEASECVILASLDANLLLAIRQLQAQPLLLDDDVHAGPDPTRADTIIMLAETLHCLIAGFRAELEQASDFF